MENNKTHIKLAIISTFLIIGLASCTHWLIDTETRIQAENLTDSEISDLSIVSENGEKRVLVPGSIESQAKSRVYEVELTGKFDFAIRIGNNWEPLGVHRLKGGSVLARIKNENGKFTITLK